MSSTCRCAARGLEFCDCPEQPLGGEFWMSPKLRAEKRILELEREIERLKLRQGVTMNDDATHPLPAPHVGSVLCYYTAEQMRNYAAEQVRALEAKNAALKREAHTWWAAARDAAAAERARCALRVALHSQYPITTDFDRGYDKARKDAAETLRTMGDEAGLELGPNVNHTP